MMKKTGRAMRLDTQIIEVRPLLLRKEQVRLRLRETCARNHKNKKPKSLDTADVVRDVVITISLIDPVTERNLGFWLAFLIFSKSKTRKPAGAFGDPGGVDNIGWTRPTGVDFGGCPPLDGRHRHDANFNLGVGRADRHSVPKIVPVAVWMR